jgi:hypothetical protein
MLGPLPRLHRWTVGALALLACIGVGAWLADSLPIPLLAPAGATIGAALGLLLVLLLLRDHQRSHQGSHPARFRRPR